MLDHAGKGYDDLVAGKEGKTGDAGSEAMARGTKSRTVHGVLWIDFDQNLPSNINNSVIKSAFNKFRHDDILLLEEEKY